VILGEPGAATEEYSPRADFKAYGSGAAATSRFTVNEDAGPVQCFADGNAVPPADIETPGFVHYLGAARDAYDQSRFVRAGADRAAEKQWNTGVRKHPWILLRFSWIERRGWQHNVE
jgi:hypothetical protein